MSNAPTIDVGRQPITINVTVLGARHLGRRVRLAGVILRLTRRIIRLLGVDLRIEVQPLGPPPTPPEN